MAMGMVSAVAMAKLILFSSPGIPDFRMPSCPAELPGAGGICRLVWHLSVSHPFRETPRDEVRAQLLPCDTCCWLALGEMENQKEHPLLSRPARFPMDVGPPGISTWGRAEEQRG